MRYLVNRRVTTIMSQNKKWYIRFNKLSGRILSIGPRVLSVTTDDEDIAITTNPICKELVSGRRNMSKFAVHWDEVNDKWDVDVKSSVIELKTNGNKLNQFIEGVNPSACDLYVKVIRTENKITIRVNFMTIRNTLNLGQISSMKNEYTNLLDLYVCKKNDPDQLIGIIPINAVELFRHHNVSFSIPAAILKHINSWNEVSIFSKPVFKTYGVEFTDVSTSEDNSTLHHTANTTDASHINMYVLSDKLIIDSSLTEDTKHYLGNTKDLKMHISNKNVDNYVTTLTLNTAKLLMYNKLEIDLPSNWPKHPVFTFKNTELTVNYRGTKT